MMKGVFSDYDLQNSYYKAVTAAAMYTTQQ